MPSRLLNGTGSFFDLLEKRWERLTTQRRAWSTQGWEWSLQCLLSPSPGSTTELLPGIRSLFPDVVRRNGNTCRRIISMVVYGYIVI